MTRLRASLPFASTTTPLQATTYLLGISLFSISFLVFLNSSISFVITDRLGRRDDVGNVVGTLGFVDELVALVACPVWGLLSDRIGVRNVAVTGYLVIGVALVLFIAARNVYPELMLARIVFALGATAAATMVTAALPSLTDDDNYANDTNAVDDLVFDSHRRRPRHVGRDSITDSLASDLTITPERLARSHDQEGLMRRGLDADSATTCPYNPDAPKQSKPNALAGFVGLFTGCGALLALVLFLPLPARFAAIDGMTMAEAVEFSYLVVACVSLLVAIFVGFGLRHLKGDENKSWHALFSSSSSHSAGVGAAGAPGHVPYYRLLLASVKLGISDSRIGLGYLGGFVARASTVAISLFIPLAVNSFFIDNGFCRGSPNDPSPELKKECRQAYILSSILTGVAQLVGLLCAPLFGYFSSRSLNTRLNWAPLLAAAAGVAGYIAFAQLQSPEVSSVDNRTGSPVVFIIMALMGFSQIGAIVCSLGSLGRGILAADTSAKGSLEPGTPEYCYSGQGAESDPLLTPAARRDTEHTVVAPIDRNSRIMLKGSIAGVYSWCGGAAILILTKLGGYLFDVRSKGAPFYMMAVFNGLLFMATAATDLSSLWWKWRLSHASTPT